MKAIFIIGISLLLSVLSFAQNKIPVGRIEAWDPEGTEVTFAISAGNTGRYFTISPCGGIVRVKETAFASFRNYRTWTLTIKVIDETGLYEKTKRKVVLRKSADGTNLKPEISDAL